MMLYRNLIGSLIIEIFDVKGSELIFLLCVCN